MRRAMLLAAGLVCAAGVVNADEGGRFATDFEFQSEYGGVTTTYDGARNQLENVIMPTALYQWTCYRAPVQIAPDGRLVSGFFCSTQDGAEASAAAFCPRTGPGSDRTRLAISLLGTKAVVTFIASCRTHQVGAAAKTNL